jgi:hypothetical protein
MPITFVRFLRHMRKEVNDSGLRHGCHSAEIQTLGLKSDYNSIFLEI